MNRLAATHAVVGIATGDTREAIEQWVRQTKAGYPVLLDDGGAARAFGVVSSPTCVLVRADGSIGYRGAEPPAHLP